MNKEDLVELIIKNLLSSREVSARHHINGNSVQLGETLSYNTESIIEGNSFEVPIFIAPHINFKDYFGHEGVTKIVIPLDFDIPTIRREAVSSIPTVFTKCFKLSRYRPLHIKEVWHKNTKYYGGCGCFFSSDKTPLIFVTTTGNITKEGATYTGIRFYFHPNIFTSENPVEKYIFKNILPAAVRDADGGIGFYPESAVNYVPTEVLIKDISGRFIKAPTIVDEVDDNNISAFLKGNIEDIYKILNISDTSSK